MDLTRQTERAADIHSRFLLSGEATCIDCHKGIAHELPNMTGVEPGWRAPPELRGPPVPEASLRLDDELAAYARDRRL
jgi:cytochrome c-type protein NapC